jgi:hypothetical protein
MSPLDQRLYAWLTEADDHRFERAFSAYFAVAFPAVVRHLSRLSRWDASQLEELAQDALLRFFERVGRGRRQASEAIRNALTLIRPLPLGAYHERQVTGWTRDVASLRDEAMGFQPTPAEKLEDAAWKAAIRRIAEQIPGLGRQGLHLLNAVQLEIHWHQAGPANQHGAQRDSPAQNFAESFPRELSSGSTRALGAERQYPLLLPFVTGTWTVTSALPQLRVPTNGYLFEMAMTIFLDECKKRGRIKRGGSGERHAPTPPPDDVPLGDRPLEGSDGQGDTGADGDHAFGADEGISFRFHSTTIVDIPVADPTLQLEHTEFLEKFYLYLRQPVEEAANACLQAEIRGKATAERVRLDSITLKLDRTLAVLTLMGEGHTQEETAAQLDLTRNQVKYIIKKVQDAYVRFTAPHTGAPSSAFGTGATHHV